MRDNIIVFICVTLLFGCSKMRYSRVINKHIKKAKDYCYDVNSRVIADAKGKYNVYKSVERAYWPLRYDLISRDMYKDSIVLFEIYSLHDCTILLSVLNDTILELAKNNIYKDSLVEVEVYKLICTTRYDFEKIRGKELVSAVSLFFDHAEGQIREYDVPYITRMAYCRLLTLYPKSTKECRIQTYIHY